MNVSCHKQVLWLIAIACFLCSCTTKVQPEPVRKLIPYEIVCDLVGMSVTEEGQPASKTSLNPDTGTASWTEGDSIAVFTPAGDRYTMKAKDSGVQTRFEGLLPEGTSKIVAIYPASEGASIREGAILTSLPGKQLAMPRGIQSDLAVIVAAGDISATASLSFKNVCGLIRFSVADSDVKAVRIVADDLASALNGSILVNPEDASCSVAKSDYTLELLPPAGSSHFATGADYIFAAIPGTIGGFTMYYECESGMKSRHTDKSMEVRKSSIITIAGNEDSPGWESDALAARLLDVTSSTATVGWTYLGKADTTRTYRVSLYGDADCSDLVTDWVLTPDVMISNHPGFIFSGLTSGKTYYAKVRDEATGHYSNLLTVNIPEYKVVTIGSEKASPGDVLLSEDFSELVFGGDCFNMACGYVPSCFKGLSTGSQPKWTITSMTPVTGTFESNRNDYAVDNHTRTSTLGLTLAYAYAKLRIRDWAYLEGKMQYNRLCERPGYVGLSNTAQTGYLVTPSLTNMSKTGTLKVSFKARGCGVYSCTVGIITGETVTPCEGQPKYGYGAITAGVLDEISTFSLDDEWKEYSVEIEDVPSGARIAIGTSQTASVFPLIAIDEVKVELVEYSQDVVGQPLAAWKEGYMDIHFLSTWSGECVFVVYPDGTTMLIDVAGDDATGNNSEIRAKWEASSKGITGCCPSRMICDYIHYMLQSMNKGDEIDYAMLTHFHPDHMGSYHASGYKYGDGTSVAVTSRPKAQNSSGWTLNGITLVMERFKVGKLVDRAYSADDNTHSYPTSLYTRRPSTLKGYSGPEVAPLGVTTVSMMNNYRFMIRSIEDHGWSKMEQFVPASDTQFAPVHNALCGVTVRNLCGGGVFWTGTAYNTENRFPGLPGTESLGTLTFNKSKPTDSAGYNSPEENHESCCVKFTYGKFTFGTLGDNTYDDYGKFSWKNAETPVAKVLGQCDVLKASHHGNDGSNGKNICNAAKPLVWIIDNWNDAQGDAGPTKRIEEATSGKTDIYLTNMSPTISKQMSSYLSKIKGYDGHIVIRVAQNGDVFRVYMLDHLKPPYVVTSRSGLYKSAE